MSLLRIAMAMVALIAWCLWIMNLTHSCQVPVAVFYLTCCSGFSIGFGEEVGVINK